MPRTQAIAEPATGQDVDYERLAEFRYQLRLFLHFSEEVARGEGVVPQQYQLMLAIKGAPAGETTHIAYLSERLQIRHHSAVELVDRLVAKALVRRRDDPSDGRRVIVELTRSGEAAMERLAQAHVREIKSGRGLVRALNAIARKPG